MINKESAIGLYRLILDRDPESEQVVNEKRKSRSTAQAAADMFMSEEFIKRNEQLIRDVLYDE